MHERNQSKRDISNFITWRDAGPADDRHIAQFLIATFSITTAKKQPSQVQTADRVTELTAVAARRASGVVRIMELGDRIVGTYALMRPNQPECLAWIPDAAYLRAVAIDPDLQGIGIASTVMEDASHIARMWGVNTVTLHVVRGSEGLERFYQRFGYEHDPSGNQVGPGTDYVGYRLTLGKENRVG